MEKVLVAGATGYLGRFVTKEFKRRGFWVRILAREKSIAKLEHPGPFFRICEMGEHRLQDYFRELAEVWKKRGS